MKNIDLYKKRFYNLMESTMGDVKPLTSDNGDFESEDIEDMMKTAEKLGMDTSELEKSAIGSEEELEKLGLEDEDMDELQKVTKKLGIDLDDYSK